MTRWLPLCLLMAAAPALASDPDTAGMKRLFDAQEAALRGADEPAYRAGWDPRGYADNLVGGSGIAGRRVFGQGTHKGWFFKPDLRRLIQAERGGPWIVSCDVWSWKKSRTVDHVWAVLLWHAESKAWRILGAGEKRAQVEALARRQKAGQPLAPPAK